MPGVCGVREHKLGIYMISWFFVVIPRVTEAENLVLSRGALDGDTYIHPYMSHVHQTRKHIHTKLLLYHSIRKRKGRSVWHNVLPNGI